MAAVFNMGDAFQECDLHGVIALGSELGFAAVLRTNPPQEIWSKTFDNGISGVVFAGNLLVVASGMQLWIYSGNNYLEERFLNNRRIIRSLVLSPNKLKLFVHERSSITRYGIEQGILEFEVNRKIDGLKTFAVVNDQMVVASLKVGIQTIDLNTNVRGHSRFWGQIGRNPITSSISVLEVMLVAGDEYGDVYEAEVNDMELILQRISAHESFRRSPILKVQHSSLHHNTALITDSQAAYYHTGIYSAMHPINIAATVGSDITTSTLMAFLEQDPENPENMAIGHGFFTGHVDGRVAATVGGGNPQVIFPTNAGRITCLDSRFAFPHEEVVNPANVQNDLNVEDYLNENPEDVDLN